MHYSVDVWEVALLFSELSLLSTVTPESKAISLICNNHPSIPLSKSLTGNPHLWVLFICCHLSSQRDKSCGAWPSKFQLRELYVQEDEWSAKFYFLCMNPISFSTPPFFWIKIVERDINQKVFLWIPLLPSSYLCNLQWEGWKPCDHMIVLSYPLDWDLLHNSCTYHLPLGSWELNILPLTPEPVLGQGNHYLEINCLSESILFLLNN